MISTWNSYNSNETEEYSEFYYKLLFIVTLIHNLLLERDRYKPFGWLENYEFGQNDLRFMKNIIIDWINKKDFKRDQNNLMSIFRGFLKNSV